jgi:hypothetical protein
MFRQTLVAFNDIRAVSVIFNMLLQIVRWPAKKVSHHLNVSAIKALIAHLDFDVD